MSNLSRQSGDFHPTLTVWPQANLTEKDAQEILKRIIVVQLDPALSPARITRRRYRRSHATAFLEQINFCVGRQLNPATRGIASKPGNRNEFAAASGRYECMSR